MAQHRKAQQGTILQRLQDGREGCHEVLGEIQHQILRGVHRPLSQGSKVLAGQRDEGVEVVG